MSGPHPHRDRANSPPRWSRAIIAYREQGNVSVLAR
jgi:hypothetical protein